MAINIPDDAKTRIHQSIHGYFDEHFDLDVGDLQSALLLEFMIKMIGTTIYNQAILDAQAYLQGKLIDLEIDLHETVEYER